MKKSYRQRKNGENSNGEARFEALVTFAFGGIQERLKGLAEGAGVPPAILTARVARLLSATARGKILWTENSL